MHKDVAVKLQNISKVYKLYDRPIDRLKESLHPFKKKYHKDFYALKNINLEIKKGEVLGIVGINGAGKSTLLKIISGVLTPTSGRVNTHGRINAILELGAGFKPEMTGIENIKLNLQINQLNDINLIDDIIQFADIGIHINQPVKMYSSGMKARLGFALATITKPDILIIDEALSVGDTAFKLKSYEKMKSLMESGCTVLYVSHSLQSIIQLCTRAVLLMDHTIITAGIPKDIIDHYQHLLFSQKKELNSVEETNNFQQYKHNPSYYSYDLIQTPNILQNYEVHIENIMILDVNKHIVNILELGQYYTITFNVNFLQTVANVLFGIQINTLNGILISGIREDSMCNTQINKDDSITVTFEFLNNFLPNTYYLNIGVASSMNGTIEYLVYHSECLLFKSVDFNVANTHISNYGIVKPSGKIQLQKRIT